MLEKKSKTISIKISGPAGSGIAVLGEILSNALNREGLFSLVYSEYPSRIRGGDNNIQIVVSDSPDLTPRKKVDVLFAFSKELLETHRGEVVKGGRAFSAQELELDQIQSVRDNPIVLNSAASGFIWKLFFYRDQKLLREIKNSVKPKYLQANLAAARAGFKMGKNILNKKLISSREKIVSMSGNEVFATSCVKADCQFASIYPMTPITGFLSSLSKTKIKTIMPEDEIYAVLSTLGASYAGKRSITATSGGGFCLMSEAVGFAGMAEVPLVVLLGQRAGPSSGIPTFSSQADLEFAIHASHGEFPRIVLSPGDLKEVYRLTQEAFNLADIYQVPVIILTDKYLSESRFSVFQKDLLKIKVKIDRGKRYKKHSKPYERYQITPSGISARAFPGETAFVTNSYEHDKYGFSTDDGQEREQMAAKRNRKLKNLTGGFSVFGNLRSREILVAWGSNKTHLAEFSKQNSKLKFVHISRVWPFPEELKEIFDKASQIIVLENNLSGQLVKIVKSQTRTKVRSILKDDGRPFFQEDVDLLVKGK